VSSNANGTCSHLAAGRLPPSVADLPTPPAQPGPRSPGAWTFLIALCAAACVTAFVYACLASCVEVRREQQFAPASGQRFGLPPLSRPTTGDKTAEAHADILPADFRVTPVPAAAAIVEVAPGSVGTATCLPIPARSPRQSMPVGPPNATMTTANLTTEKQADACTPGQACTVIATDNRAYPASFMLVAMQPPTPPVVAAPRPRGWVLFPRLHLTRQVNSQP
jgi:hypothetical protein